MPNRVVRAIIPAGEAVSNPIDLGDDSSRLGLILEGGWSDAGLSFLVGGGEQGEFRSLYDDAGVEVAIDRLSLSPGRAISLTTPALREALAPWRYIKIRSGTVAAPVDQLADRTIVVSTEH